MSQTQVQPTSRSLTGIYRTVVPVLETGSRRTKIVATLGPSTADAGMVERLAQAGMDAARLNFSHGSHADHLASLDAVRAAEDLVGRPLAVIADLCGPKIRLGPIEDRSVRVGDLIDFAEVGVDDRCIPVSLTDLASKLAIGQRVLIDDGKVRTRVVAKSETSVTCLVETAGTLKSRKGVNLPDTGLDVACLTPKDLDDLAFACAHDVDYVALSFVRRVSDIEDLRDRLRAANSRARIIAKIEHPEAIENVEDIVKATDAVMVARGDLGVEMGPAEVPLLQKRIIELSRINGRTVITATQMLESMVESSEPTRAEVSDVANAIFDGTAIMLSAETASGAFPVRAVEVLDEIARNVEGAARERSQRLPDASVSAALMHAACEVAGEVGASAIAVPTTTGSTPRELSRLRPHQPVVAACSDPLTRRQLALDWGIVPIDVPESESLEEMWRKIVEASRSQGVVAAGDLIVLTGRHALADDADASHLALQRVPPAVITHTG